MVGNYSFLHQDTKCVHVYVCVRENLAAECVYVYRLNMCVCMPV